jgi:hypothetical protein
LSGRRGGQGRGLIQVAALSHRQVIASFSRRKYIAAEAEDWPEGQVVGVVLAAIGLVASPDDSWKPTSALTGLVPILRPVLAP